MEKSSMRKFLQKLLLVALLCVPWVTMSQGYDYACDFDETSDATGWIFVNTADATGSWMIGSDNVSGDAGNSLYVSPDGESHWATEENADYYAYKTLNLGAGTYQYSYDWCCTGSTGEEYMRVALVPASTTFPIATASDITNSSLPTGWVAMDGGSELSDGWEWVSRTGEVTVPTDGNYHLLVFYRSGEYCYYFPGAIDNISLTLPNITCPAPSNVNITDLKGTSAIARWTAEGTTSVWEVTYGVAGATGTTQTVYVDSIEMTGLTPNTDYEFSIKSVCGADNSMEIEKTFHTPCADIVLPYVESFESTMSGEAPMCWSVKGGEVTVAMNSDITEEATDGVKYLKLKKSGVVASSYIPVACNTLEVVLDARKSSTTTAGKLEVGFATDLSQLSSAVVVSTINPTDILVHNYEIDCSLLGIPTGGYLVLRQVENTNDYGSYYIDNIQVHILPTCRRPVAVSVSDVTAHEAMITWSEVEGANEYEVVYGLVDDPTSVENTSISVLGDNTLQLTELTSESEYFVWVRNNCGEEYSEWRKGGSFTTDISCAQIVNFTVADLTSTGMALTWDFNTAIGTLGTQTEISWKSTDELSYHTAITDNKYFFISNLQPTTAYEVRLRTICEAGDTSSAYTTTVNTVLNGKVVEGNLDISNEIPTTTYYNNCYSQSIYLASDLQGVDTIRSIAYHLRDNKGEDRTLDVYMGNVMRSQVGYNNHVAIDSLTKVGDGLTLVSQQGWSVLTLDTPFVRGGDSNLVIAINDRTWRSTSSLNTIYFYVHSGYTIVKHSDRDTVSPQKPGNWSSYTSHTKAPDIAFPQAMEAGCSVPLVLVNGMASTSAQLLWNGVGEGATYQVEYKLQSATDWSVANASVTDTFATVDGLTPGNFYEFRVGTQYNGEMLYSSVVEGFSKCDIVNVPLVEHFASEELNPCWTIGNSDGSNTLPNLGYEALYMSFKPGCYVILPEIAEDLPSLQILFSMKCSQANSKVVVYATDNKSDTSSFVAIDTLTAVTSGEYVRQVCQFSEYLGEGHFIVLKSLNKTMYIDEIEVDFVPNCSYPQDLTISDLAATSATLSWGGNSGNSVAWMITYNVEGSDIIDTIMAEGSATSVVLSGLNSNTDYVATVYNICTEDTLAALSSVSFKTECGDMVLPFVMNFDNEAEEVMPDCWNSTDMHEFDGGWNSYMVPTISSQYGGHGNVLEFTDNVNMITPRLGVDASTIQMIFEAKADDADNTGDLAIGISTSRTDISQAIYVDTIHLNSTSWQTYNVSFASLPEGTMGGYVVFNNINNVMTPASWYDEFYSGYIDNITIMIDYGCADVENIRVTEVAPNSARISFADATATGDYTVGYSTNNDVNNIEHTVDCTDSTVVISGLSEFTKYYTWVRTNCNGGSSLWMEGPSFRTTCSPIAELPYEEDFDSYTGYGSSANSPSGYPNHTMPNCWSFLNMSMSSTDYPQAFLAKSSTSKPYGDSAACLIMSSAVEEPIFAVIPSFETPIDSLQISFTYAQEGVGTNNGYLTLGVMTDASDTATFMAIREYPQVEEVTSVIHNFSLDNLTGSNYTIAFRYMGGTVRKLRVGIDHVLVERAASCIVPEMFALTSLEGSSATFTWSAVASAYNVEYRMSSDTEWTEVSNINANTVTLNGLNSQTEYQVRVQSVCGTDTSAWTSAIKFKTPCGLARLPFREDFNDYTEDIAYNTSAPSSYPNHFMPDCWTFPMLGNSPKAFLTRSTKYAQSGIGLFMTSNASKYMFAVLPMMAGRVDSLQITFSYCNENNIVGSDPSIEVGVMTDPNDTTTFVMLEAYPPSKIYTTVEHVFGNDNLDPNTNYNIAFRYGGAGGYRYFGMDDIEVKYAPTCPRPKMAEIDSLTAKTAHIHWVSSADNFEFSYKKGASEVWNTINVADTHYLLTNLSASASYEVRVRAICSATDTSEWSVIQPFSTDCGVVELPFAENFNTYTDINEMTCWSRYLGLLSDINAGTGNLSIDSRWKLSSSYPMNNGGKYAHLNIYNVSSKNWLVTPQIYIPGATTFEFDLARRDYNDVFDDDDKFIVLISTDSLDTWTSLRTWTGTDYSSIPLYNGTPQHVAIDLSQYIGDTVHIAFYGESTVSGGDHYIQIDNVEIPAPACELPTSLVANNITDSSADLSWTGTVEAYDVEYRVANTTEWTSLQATTNTITLNGLEDLTIYEWRVRGNCGYSVSDWDTSTFTTLVTPCAMVSNLVASNVTDNSADLTWNGSAAAYDVEYRVAEVAEWTALTATETSISLTGLTELTDYEWRVRGNCGDDNVSDWVTSTFTTLVTPCAMVSNLVASNVTDSSADLTWNGSATAYDVEYRVVDATEWTAMTATETSISLTGLTELTAYEWRVRGNCGNDNVSDWDTSTFTTLVTPCAMVSNLAVSEITDSSVVLTWNGSATAYDVEYRIAEAAEWTAMTTIETSMSLTGLTAETAYEWRVRGNCGNDNVSDWDTSAFTTLVAPCIIPTDLTATVEEGVVTLDWTAAEGQTSWEVSVNAEGIDEILQVVNVHPTVMSDLIPATYTVKVRAICAEDRYSDWSESVEFIIEEPVCESVTDVAVSEITENGAKLTWTAAAEQTAWEIVYGEAGFDHTNAQPIAVDATEYILSDLTANTSYDVYVRAVCGEDFYSEWSEKVTFQTLESQEGIDDVDGQFNLAIYPNPAHSTTTISLSGVEGKVTISVVDMNGRYITSESLECGYDCEKRIDVEGLAQGTYFVRVLGDNINSVRKLIVR